MYPRMCINTKNLLHNVRTVNALCLEHHIQITAITKMFCGDPKLAQTLLDGGIHMLGDARIENLHRMEKLAAEKWLIRIPMPSEAANVIRYADVSVNSELYTIQVLQKEAKKQHKMHKILLMADLGDIREGYVDYKQLINTAQLIRKMDSLKLYGVGTNLTCFSFIHPNYEKLKQLEDLSCAIADENQNCIVSGGNSATIELMLKDKVPDRINNLRIGEALLFGRERAHYQYLQNTYSNVFVMQAEIVELKNKPSMPWGEIGVNSYGKKPEFVNRGIRTRAICAIGSQDIDIETMDPTDPDIALVGASSDHLVLDITDSHRHYSVGGIIEFKLGYFAAMRAFTSQYVQKLYY